MKSAAAKHQSGIALVVTLVILVLLVGMAVALLQTSGLERGTSKGVAEKAKADLAAQTAANTAIARFVDNLTTYPDSATSWEKVNNASGSVLYQGTTLYYREKTPEANISTTAPPLHALPLISGADAVTIPDPPQSTSNRELTLRGAFSATTLDNTNSYDLNRARFSGDTQGAIGAPTGSTSRPEFRGQWIDLTDSTGKKTGRYAYWMEDESFKVNANYARDVLRGANTLGVNASEIPLQGLLKAIGNSDPDGTATSTVTYRNSFPSGVFYEYRALNQVSGQPTLADDAKFEATVFSGATDLSRSGMKRLDLNAVVSTSTDPTTIRKQLDEIIKAVTVQLPNFGQRFYRLGTDLNALDVIETGTSKLRTIYLNRLAANIRDYIDTDSQPTILNNDSGYTVKIGSAPTEAIRPLPIGGSVSSGDNQVIAIGKERVPMIQEYAIRVREIEFSARTGASSHYKITIDHYVEFWNQSNKDILLTDLGSNPFLLIANQPGWDGGSLSQIPEGRDIKLPLSQATNSSTHAALTSFPAGSITVITTDPLPLNNPPGGVNLTPDLTKVYYIPVTPDTGGTAGLRTYFGDTDKKSGSQLRLNIIPRTTSNTDYDTEIALGNDSGILESAWGAAVITSQISINTDLATPAENKFDDTNYHFRGGLLHGNINGAPAPKATVGDPRTNAGQLRFELNGATANTDKTRYYDSNLSNKTAGNSSLGAPNSFYTDPSQWIDYSSGIQSANDAPAVIANANLNSIGELGHIFDPVLTKGDATGNDTDGVPLNIKLSRSGGRTLKIGQPNRFDATTNAAGLWDGNSNSASREWTAWRLTDIFSTSNTVQLDGRININGLNRDDGAALKAALYGYQFRPTPDCDPNLAGKSFDTDPTNSADKINELVRQLQARLKNDTSAYSNKFANTVGPLEERGELSEMPIFNTGTDLASGVDAATVFDRGREELFRRIAELITTRGNIFTVYAVGQSLVPQAGAALPVVTATSQFKVTFRIDPVWTAGTPVDPFDPSDTTATNNRFKKPDKYAIKILYVGD